MPFLSPLHQAIFKGSLQEFKRLIKRKENPLAKDIDGNSCLHYAAQLHRFGILRYLIEEIQCPPGTKGWNGSTILHIAAQTKQFDTVQYLVESEHCKLDPTIENNNGHSALHCACQGGDLKTICYLIESMTEYMKLEDVLYDNSTPPLQSDSAELGIEDYTQSPLSCACYRGNLPIVKYLVEECHCDPSKAHGTKQKMPIESAIVGNHLDIVKYLASIPNFQVPYHEPGLLFLAVKTGCTTTLIDYLINTLKFDYNKQYMGLSPLHLASIEGNLDMVKYFITVLKCNPRVKGYIINIQPIHCASDYGHIDIVRYLIEQHSVSPTSLTDNRETPLHLAAISGHIALAKYLTIEQNCNPSLACSSGSSLHVAAYGGHVEIARYFVESMGCDPNIRNGDDHCTPLHIAAECGQLDFINNIY